MFTTRAVPENADNKLDGNLGQIAVGLRRMLSSLAGMPLSGVRASQAHDGSGGGGRHGDCGPVYASLSAACVASGDGVLPASEDSRTVRLVTGFPDNRGFLARG